MKDILKIIRYSWSLKRYYAITAFFVVVLALLNQATPFLLKFIVDNLVEQIKGHSIAVSTIVILLLGIVVVNLAISFFENIQGYFGDMLGVKLNSLLSQRYYEHVLSLPLEYYDNEVTGQITSRLERGIVTISSLIQTFANFFVSMFLSVIFTLIIMAYYSWPVALFFTILFPLYIWLTTLSSHSWQKKQEPINRETDISNGRFIEAISQIRAVKSFVQETAESRFYRKMRQSIEDRTQEQSVQWHKYDVIRRVSLNLIFGLTYAFIIWQTYKGQFTLGTMTLMIQLATQAQFPLFASSFIVDNIQKAVAGSRDFFKVMSIKPKIQDAPDARELKVGAGKVEYQGVDFAYHGGEAVLKDISFTVEPGTKLALVGESGEGKTTISNLLLRFYEANAGKILVDGQPVDQVTQTSLRRAIGVVFQEPALFSGTVKENITYGEDKVSQEDLEAAARAANAHDFISKLPKGYDTEIGERGVKLSGGQKQRVAIARAILKNPPILILDEATSSLDSKAEREVQSALERLMSERTTLIIAHRLSTIANVDQVVGIRQGRVAEKGSPEELASGKGIYAELLALQLAPASKATRARLKEFDIAR